VGTNPVGARGEFFASSTALITGQLQLVSELRSFGTLETEEDFLATTTTGASADLTQADLEDIAYHVVTTGDLVEGSDFTFTMPATSTLDTYLSRIGAKAENCFFFTATTSDSNLIFAAGTGWDFVYASSTITAIGLGPLQVGSTETICIESRRQPDDSGSQLGDITAEFKAFEDLD